MKVNIKKIKMDDVWLSRLVGKKVAKLLMPSYEYLVTNLPEGSFCIHDDGMELLSVNFYNSDVGDILTVRNKSIWLDFHNGDKIIIAQYKSFRDLLHLQTKDLYFLPMDDKYAAYIRAKNDEFRGLID